MNASPPPLPGGESKPPRAPLMSSAAAREAMYGCIALATVIGATVCFVAGEHVGGATLLGTGVFSGWRAADTHRARQ